MIKILEEMIVCSIIERYAQKLLSGQHRLYDGRMQWSMN